MKLISKFSSLLAIAAVVLFASCEKDDNYEPLIGTGAEMEFASQIPSVDINSVKLLWYPNNDAISYTVEYSVDSTFAGSRQESEVPTVYQLSTVDNRITISDLEYETKYFARVRAEYLDGTSSSWTEPALKFETKARPIPVVLLIQPTDVVGIRATFRWNIEKYSPTHLSFELYDPVTDTWSLWLPDSTPATLEEAMMEFTDEDKATGVKTMEIFPEMSTLRATIYDTSLGMELGTFNTVEFTTYVYLPEGVIMVPNGMDLTAILDAAADGADIFLEKGYMGTWGAATIRRSFNISSDPTVKAVLNFTSSDRSLLGDAEGKLADISLNFKNIIFNVSAANTPSNIFLLDNRPSQHGGISTSFTGMSFIFENCDFLNVNTLIRVRWLGGGGAGGSAITDLNFKEIKYDKCYFYWDANTITAGAEDGLVNFPFGKDDGRWAFSYPGDKGTGHDTHSIPIEKYTVTNSTFVNAKRRFVNQYGYNAGINLYNIVYTIQNSSFIGSDGLNEGMWFRFSQRSGAGGREDRSGEKPYQINYFNCLFAKLPSVPDVATFNPMGLAQARFQGRVFRSSDQRQTGTDAKRGFEGRGLSGDSEAMIDLGLTSEDIFVNVNNQDFHFKPEAIYESTPLGQMGIGDPRWYDAGVVAPVAPASPGDYPAYDTDMI